MRKLTALILLFSFFVLSVTGVLLMLHIRVDLGSLNIKSLHEFVGYAFIAAGISHILLNRRSLLHYIKPKA